MEIFIWIITVVSLSVILGECYYRYLKKIKEKHHKKIAEISDSNDETIKYSMDDLCIEATDVISRRKLQMRGSWRLAKDKTMSYLHFKRERDNEYKKML